MVGVTMCLQILDQGIYVCRGWYRFLQSHLVKGASRESAVGRKRGICCWSSINALLANACWRCCK